MSGLRVICPHIPAFGYPALRGYVYRGSLTLKALTCLGRRLSAAVDQHIFTLQNGRLLRRLYRNTCSTLYRKTLKEKGGLFDEPEFRCRRQNLKSLLKSGEIGQKEYQRRLEANRKSLDRHAHLLFEAKTRFNRRIGELFGRYFAQKPHCRNG
ncbi:MAG: hypothetical protein R6V67_09960 [Spirochaetia bacterium]